MKPLKQTNHYSIAEERFNISSHAIGFILSLIALVLLANHAQKYGNLWHIVSFSVFGLSLILLYAASTLYHSETNPVLRSKLRIIDHATIYILIAGTYTPFTLITLGGVTGWVIFGVSWSMACVGVIVKIFFTGKYDLISTLMYVFMGWIIIFDLDRLFNNLSSEGLFWLVAGGVAYTVGAVIYSIEAIKFNHAIFHVFILIGSACHFISVYFYVLPSAALI